MNPTKNSRLKRPPTLTDEVARRLIEAIRDGQYKPGERLPTENELCEAYGVSRPVLREAISQLKFKGLVVPQQGRGVFVSESGYTDSFELDVDTTGDNQQILQIMEVVLAVQVYCAGVAAEKRTKKQLADIGKVFDKLDEKMSAGSSASDEDASFHNAIVNATNNPYFVSLHAFLEGNVQRFIERARNAFLKEHIQHDASNGEETLATKKILQMKIIEEHEAIYKAIEEQDAEKARQATEYHLREVYKRIAIKGGIEK